MQEPNGSVRDAALTHLERLVAFETVTETSNLELIGYCAALLERAGADVFLASADDGERANLFATFAGGADRDGGVVLSGHTDVIPAAPDGWTSPPFTAVRRDERIFGRGTADMKGFIACLLASAGRFGGAGLRRPVHVALTYDEEVGCRGAPVLLDELGRRGIRPGLAIVGEPTGMDVVHAHKGCYEYTTVIRGVEGHGSAPGRGINAVEYGTRYVAELLRLRDELAGMAGSDLFDPPTSTLNVGVVSGGSARNVVAGHCEIEWEMRPVSRDHAEHVLGRVASLERRLDEELRSADPSAGMERHTAGAVGGLEPAPDSSVVALLMSLLPDASLETASYNTEAGVYAAAGIPSAVCGPGSIAVAHRPDEHVSIAQLDRCLAMLDDLAGFLENSDTGSAGLAG